MRIPERNLAEDINIRSYIKGYQDTEKEYTDSDNKW